MDGECFRRCNACKEDIAFGATYWVCSVSTCNRKRTALSFCSVDCWEVHLPGANHRESWAVETQAPKSADAEEVDPKKTRDGGKEVLIVASRLKDYVRARAGYNTSSEVLEPLSAIVRQVCDQAIENARRDGRMTVLGRDIPER